MASQSLARKLWGTLGAALLLSGLLPPAPAAAQNEAGYWRHYTATDSGLLSNTVQALVYTEDRNVDIEIPGLWIGTDAGLHYTNSRDWTAYTVENSSLPANNIQALLKEPGTSVLWVATTDGLARLDYNGTPRDRTDDRWLIFTTTHGLPANQVLSLSAGKDNTLWAGTTQGLARYDGKSWTAYQNTAPGLEVRELIYDAARDRVWTATESGVGMLDVAASTWAVIQAGSQDAQLPGNDVRTLTIGGDGKLWFGTTEGLATFDPEYGQDQQLPGEGGWEVWVPGSPGIPPYAIVDLSFDPTGRHLWIATQGGGVSRYDTQADHWERFNTFGSELPDDHVRVILHSHPGITWIGTTAGLSGLERLWEPRHFLAPADAGSLPYAPVIAAWFDPERGTLWVGSEDGGVSRSDDGGITWQTFTTANGLGSNSVFAIGGDRQGTVWVGTDGGGVSRSDDGGATWQTFGTDRGLGAASVPSLWVEEDGTVWAGPTDGGVNRSTDGGLTWEIVNAENVFALWGDGKGTVWADPGYGSLLYTRNGGESWRDVNAPVITTDFPSSLWGDANGALWVGSSEGEGLYLTRDNGRNWQNFTTLDGLTSDVIVRLWGDARGGIWAGTDNGVSVSPNGGESWEAFTIEDGVGEGIVSALCGDPEGGAIWAITWNAGTPEAATLNHSPDGGQSWKRFSVDPDNTIGTDNVIAIQGAGRDNLWVGLYGLGVAHSNNSGESWQLFTPDDGLGSPYTMDIWVDNDSIWVGSKGGGVSLTTNNGRSWQTFTTANGLGSNDVFAVWEDRAGTVWAGTEGGGISYSIDNGASWESLEGATGLASDVVTAIYGGSSGTLWAGTRNGGVSRSADLGLSWQAFTTTHGLGSDAVNAVWIDSRDTVWVGTSNGLSRSTDAGNNWRTLTVDNGLGSNTITAVWGDNRGTLWACTSNSINRSADNGEHWQSFRMWGATSVWGNTDGALWVGNDQGLHRFRDVDELPPVVQWLEPVELTTGATFRLLDESRVIEARFAGLKFAPASDAGSIEYTAVLSPTLPGVSVFTQTFAVGEIGPLGIAQVTFGEGATSLKYGDYKLQLTAQGAFGGQLATSRDIEVQARPFITHTHLAEGHVSHTVILTSSLNVTLIPTTVVLAIGDPDSGDGDFLLDYAIDPLAEPAWQALETKALVLDDLSPGLHKLALRATDSDGNTSDPPIEIPIQITGPSIQNNLLWLFIGAMITTAVVGATAILLKDYPEYVGQWAAARDYPLQQLIPLLIPPGEAVETGNLRQRLQAAQAYATDEQIQDALDGLLQRGLLQQEGKLYRSAAPWSARMHHMIRQRRIPELVEHVRTRHPLYARARDFFDQAHFRLDELSAEEFLLIPQGQDHPLAGYNAIYARLIAGRAPVGNDFTQVCEAARMHYTAYRRGKPVDLAHRVAMVISDRRPEIGARYRLYEIRQREGLAIVPLDSSLFSQIKPSRSANAILADEIDQATGQQNLYAISAPVSSDLSFFGREPVLQELIDLLDAGQPVGIFGLRKAGKTSLIQRLQGRLTRRPTAFVDTQGITRQQGVWPLYPAIIAAFATAIERTRPDITLPELDLYPHAAPLSPTMAGPFVKDLAALHSALGQPSEKERMLLIIDEIDRLLPYGETPGYEGFSAFFGQLRAANQQARLLDFVVVGVDPAINRSERWEDHDNELYRALHELWMPPMAWPDVQEMIESLGSQMGVRYQPAALHRLAQSGGGHPFVTRQICSYAVKDQLGRGVITVTMDQAEMALEEFVFQDPYLTELWRNRLTGSQQEMLRTLARAAGPIPRAQLLPPKQRQFAVAALKGLEESTLVRHGREGYIIAWAVLRDWIRWIELGLEA